MFRISKRLRAGLMAMVMSALAGLVLVSLAPAGKPPPPAPSVRYTMALVVEPLGSSAINVRSANKYGELLGSATYGVGEGIYDYPMLWSPFADGSSWVPDETLGDTLALLAAAEMGLATVPAFTSSGANVPTIFAIEPDGINDSGQICGRVHYGTKHQDAGGNWVTDYYCDLEFRYTPDLDPSNDKIELLLLANVGSCINNHGDVACEKYLWLHDAGSAVRLPIPSSWGSGKAVNDNLVITGWTYVNGVEHAFRFTVTDPATGKGTFLDLGVLGAPKKVSPWSEGWAINNNGQVAGMTTAAVSGIWPFRYTDGVGMVNLGVLSGETNAGSMAQSINSRGQVAGKSYWYDRSGAAHTVLFLYTDATGMIDVYPLITNAQALGVAAADIADSSENVVIITDCPGHNFGRICGCTNMGTTNTGIWYVLTPNN